MKNRWNITNQEVETKETEEKINNTPEVENSKSKKIGIAMGVVGALLVVAGVSPMFFPSENLEGDLTKNQQEEIDPLVALLSDSTNETDKNNNEVKKANEDPSTQLPPSVNKNKDIEDKNEKNENIKNNDPLDKISTITNKNTGKSDKAGNDFGELENLHSASDYSSKTQQPKPNTTVQTGTNEYLFLGLLFIIISGGLYFNNAIRSRK